MLQRPIAARRLMETAADDTSMEGPAESLRPGGEKPALQVQSEFERRTGYPSGVVGEEPR